MATRRKCRSCDLTNQLIDKPIKHKLISVNFRCPLCNKIPKWYSHLHEDLSGDSLECKSCHNYILYNSTDAKIEDTKKWKDEIHFFVSGKEFFVMRDYEDSRTYVWVNDSHNPIKLNSILEFKSLEDLINKVKTIVVFS